MEVADNSEFISTGTTLTLIDEQYKYGTVPVRLIQL